ncbi:DUF1365 domain-containing protein [Ciceribacter sp. L1K22]|uniref:DUF1365 domain-containing protein n=1 Tax=Ciceribacter sp. L1K22 TaxID=2820275 RepID=UPI001ABDF290|nr:DUF1365 domain-containing protein [Ciceribacter sp. L1K22]MBO3762151.1 DUF1365 domain-containing protein [Ciceribacter sp. L1K22]
MRMKSALYPGEVVHARHRPRPHELRYGVVSFLLHLDELELLDRKFRFFGYNRFAPFTFDDRDHGTGERGDLKRWVLEQLARADIAADGLDVTVLCYPRVFGYGFNPLTVYFCNRPDGSTAAVLYEVSNTFRERHTYVIPVSTNGAAIRHRCDKEMYVSPFMPMDCHYRFRVVPPDDKVLIAIDEHDRDGSLLFASFSGRRKQLTEAGLILTALRYPLMTMKIMGAIHWEALRLWLKGIPVHRHKKARDPIATSIVSPAQAAGSERA